MSDTKVHDLSSLGKAMSEHAAALDMLMTYRFVATRSRADALVLDSLLQSAVGGGRDLNHLRTAAVAAMWALREAGDYDNAGRMLHVLDLLEHLNSVIRILGTVQEDYKP